LVTLSDIPEAISWEGVEIGGASVAEANIGRQIEVERVKACLRDGMTSVAGYIRPIRASVITSLE